jgi:hypothetical protein
MAQAQSGFDWKNSIKQWIFAAFCEVTPIRSVRVTRHPESPANGGRVV